MGITFSIIPVSVLRNNRNASSKISAAGMQHIKIIAVAIGDHLGGIENDQLQDQRRLKCYPIRRQRDLIGVIPRRQIRYGKV